MKKGDYLTIAVLDCLNGFSDNTGSVTISITSAPTITITDARMISPGELGIGAVVTYPKDCTQGAATTIAISGTVDGNPIQKTIIVPDSVIPGGQWGTQVSVDQYGRVLSTTPLRINLADQNVPRFTKDVTFTVTATASCKPGIKSGPSKHSGSILLPVLIIHGVETEWWHPLATPAVYLVLTSALESKGYSSRSDTSGDYKTLWTVKEITYSSKEDTANGVAAKMIGYINKATSRTYAAKVNLIGHSLGGLIGRFVTTEYEAKRSGGPRIHKLIMIGTPNNGSASYYKIAFSGTREDITSQLRTTAGKPNLKQWLSPGYPKSLFLSNDNSVIEIKNPDEKLSTNLFTNRFKASGYDKPQPEGVTYYSIFNTQLTTLTSVTVKPFPGWYTSPKDRSIEGGDGTVIARSARMMNSINKPVAINADHVTMMSNQVVINKVFQCLNTT